MVRKGPAMSDFFGEYPVEITSEGWLGQRVGIDIVESAPLIVHDLARNVDQGKPVEAAGHGAMFVNEAAAVLIQKRTGSFVVIGHECFPLIFGAHVEDERLIEFGPYQPEASDTLSAPDKDLLAYLRIKQVETPAKKRCVQECYVEEPPTTLRTAVGAADAVARTAETGAKPVVDPGEQSAVLIENFFQDSTKKAGESAPACLLLMLSKPSDLVRPAIRTW